MCPCVLEHVPMKDRHPAAWWRCRENNVNVSCGWFSTCFVELQYEKCVLTTYSSPVTQMEHVLTWDRDGQKKVLIGSRGGRCILLMVGFIPSFLLHWTNFDLTLTFILSNVHETIHTLNLPRDHGLTHQVVKTQKHFTSSDGFRHSVVFTNCPVTSHLFNVLNAAHSYSFDFFGVLSCQKKP